MVWVDNATPEVDAISEWRTIVAICTVLSAFSMGIVCARVWIRNKNHGLAADDWMSILSMVFALIYSILCIVRTCTLLTGILFGFISNIGCCSSETKYGLGLPLLLRPKANLIPYTRSNYAGRPIYQMGISFFKVALLISYLRLFKGTSHTVYRRVVWIAMVAIVAGHLGCSLTLILACSPVSRSPRLHALSHRACSAADVVSQQTGSQVMGSRNTRHVSCCRAFVHRICHCHHRVRRRRRHHPDSRAPPAQGQHRQEGRPHCHFPFGSLHDPLLGLPVSPDQQDPVWRRKLDHANSVGCDRVQCRGKFQPCLRPRSQLATMSNPLVPV